MSDGGPSGFGAFVRWCCVAIPAVFGLWAIGVLGLAYLWRMPGGMDLEAFPQAILLFGGQTLGPILAWTAVLHWAPRLRKSRVLETLCFPWVVGAVGWVLVLVVGAPEVPRLGDLSPVAIVGWLGFAYALLVSRWLADAYLPKGGFKP